VKRFLIISVLLAVPLLKGCKPGSEKGPSFQFEKGFGSSKEHPEGKPFAWPTGLRVVGPLITEDECFYEAKNKRRLFGHGAQVQICLNLYNETQAPIRLQLPPGLMFVSKSLDVQNGLLITGVTILVPPGEQFFANLYMICVNTDRKSPGHDEYEEQAIITDHPALRDLMKLLENKKCNFEDYGGIYLEPTASEITYKINAAVHPLIYGKPVKSEVMAELSAIPER
jgi:hypothetical protein